MNEHTLPTTTGPATTPPASGTGRPPRRYRLGATAVVLALVLGALAALVPANPAGAALPTSGGSIAYVKDANVWLTTPDGATKRQVTTDGATATGDATGSGPYLAPSRSDAGDVLVAFRNEGRTDDFFRVDPYLWVMDPQGKVIRKFLAPQYPRQGNRCVNGDPTSELVVAPRGMSDAVVSPNGAMIAYVVEADFFAPGRCDRPDRHSMMLVTNTDNTGWMVVKGTSGDPFGPSWLNNSRLLLSDAPGNLYFVDVPSDQVTLWKSGGGFFPEQRAGKLATNGWDGAGALIRLWSSSGPPALPIGRCDYRGPAGGADGRFGDMSWAPDGGGLVWEEGDGVADETDEGLWIMPVGDINATCGAPTDPQVFIPGAYRPHWGPAAVNPPPLPTLAVNDVSVTEGNSGSKTATFTITRTGDLSRSSSVNWATADGTAVAPGDYLAQAGAPVNFAANDPTETVSVTVNGDTTVEANETFSVKLSAPVAATITDGNGVGTITNDDTNPTLAINDVTVAEGNSGTKSFTFTITRSGDLTRASTVKWNTADGTATAPGDYLAQAGATVNFAANDPTETVSVTVNGDTAIEPTETFSVALTSPVDATIADGTGVGTITDDDATSLAVNDVSVVEGGSGTTTATFNITRSGNATGISEVTWATADGSAIAPGDYLAQAPKMETFAANETTKQVSVTVNGDTTVESNETFTVRLSAPTGATIADGIGVGTIANDDTSLKVNDVTVTEGSSGTTTATFTITRSGNATGISEVTWATANGSAIAPGDYLAQAPMKETFAANETTKRVSVTVNGDPTVEYNETFTVRLSAPTGATIADGIGVGTITNDDTGLKVNDVSVVEGASGTRLATFTITRTGVTTGISEVTWATADGSAVAPGDYLAQAPKKETFAANETTKQVSVTVNGDPTVEYNETFTVRLSAPTGATIVDGTGVGTITNDDTAVPPPTLAVNDVSVTEGNAGTTAATFTITRSGDPSGTSTVSWGTVDGTARAPDDYVTQYSKQETFGPNETTKQVSVSVNGDIAVEDHETFQVWLGNPSGATLADDRGTGTITNDDPVTQVFQYPIGEHVSHGQPWFGAGVIEVPSAVDRYVFDATSGRRVFVDGFRVTNCALRWNLTGPGGVTVFADRGMCDGDPGNLTLPATGTYTLTAHSPGNSTETGGYGFRINDVPAPQSFQYTIGSTVDPGEPWGGAQPGPGAGTIEDPGAVDTYTFTVPSSQTLDLWRQDAGGSPCGFRWSITGPGGSAVVGDRGWCDPEPRQVALTAGTYTLTVSSASILAGNDAFYTGTYRFSLFMPPQHFQYTIGTTVSDGRPAPGAGNLEVPGAKDHYIFSGTAGQRVIVDWISASACTFRWDLVAPSGWITAGGCNDSAPLTLPDTGTYTLTFSTGTHAENLFATYSFRVVPAEVEVPNALEMSEGAAGQLIRDAGLVPQFTGAVGRAGAWVSDQSPWPGTMAAPGSIVSLHLSTGPIP